MTLGASTGAVAARRSGGPVPPATLYAGLALIALLSVALNLGSGAVRIPADRLPALLAGLAGLAPVAPDDRSFALVLGAIRGPRILLGLCIGAALGAAGAAMQGLFRNPLAEPGLLGVASGAALFAAAAIVLGAAFLGNMGHGGAVVALPVCAFLGALAATAAVLAVRRIDPAGGLVLLLLGGIAVNALAGAGIGLLTFLSNDQQLRTLTFWMLGSLGNAAPLAIWPAMALMLAATAALFAFRRPLDLLALGEEAAGHAGVDVRRVERGLSVTIAVAVGAAVSVSGIIGFVGLVVPHLVRLLAGPSQRLVLPASALAGAGLLTLADLAARTVVIPAELPIGIVTSLVGAPVFLWLLFRTRTGTRGATP